MIEAVEITTFKLVRGCSGDKFIAANAEIDAWLKRQSGFRSRRILERDDGTIVDMLLWDSAAESEASMHRLMDELRDSPVHKMIDQRTVSWSVLPVRHCVAMRGTAAQSLPVKIARASLRRGERGRQGAKVGRTGPLPTEGHALNSTR